MNFLADTNKSVYAASASFREPGRAKSSFFEHHRRIRAPWCLTWGIVYEFLRVMTHPRILPEPLTADEAMSFVYGILAPGDVAMLTAGEERRALLHATMPEIRSATGNIVRDVYTAVILREHGVGHIVTAGSDFLQFKFRKVIDPTRD